MVLIMELLGPGISDSIEIKARYYGMHWDIVGDNDGIYDKMADMLMAISCGPKICFVDRLWRMYLPQHGCWRGRKRNESLAPQPGGDMVVSTTSHVRRGPSYHWFLRISWGFYDVLWVPEKSGTHQQL